MIPAEIEAQRARVVEAALGWMRTPFHDNACLKGVGVDCAMLVKAVYEEAGLVDQFEVSAYSAQWFLHRSEELFLGYVSKYARPIEESEAGPGDIVVFKIGRCFAHGAIVADWPQRIIHAHKLSRMVIESRVGDADLRGLDYRIFSPWKE